MLEKIERGPPDPMFELKANADMDEDPRKVDLGVGIYRNEAGSYEELETVTRYGPTTGDADFLRLGAGLLFGKQSQAIATEKICSVQTISGTGANSLAALLIGKEFPSSRVYISLPTWGNHVPIFQHVGLQVSTYEYLDSSGSKPDMEALLHTVRVAPPYSIFVLQGCCHNPTGVDFSVQQWVQLAEELKDRTHIVVIDIAYQGLGEGLDEDAAGLRTLAEAGLELLVCQSFSKNFALYNERCGALHAVCKSSAVAADVKDKLRSLIRHTYSSSPAYGSRLVKVVLNDEVSCELWIRELERMRSRLKKNRQNLLTHLAASGIPEGWSDIAAKKGLFVCLPLTAEQCSRLTAEHHIHLPENGRINIAGLSADNVRRTAQVIATEVNTAFSRLKTP
ncbi:pyridoxal phosphate-dependent transferase [Paraphoma chrysanthemicola]|uniref:Pyridoxal phosphate-dependent transferase n=1 Tax=Paraphoma chrysanthemicola TaxID=798071 RepID=A0A8K0VS04_9PLEO|nr:pyridoxal phosphate-dependent transferase [Paraphoma chrysanthemicola]